MSFRPHSVCGFRDPFCIFLFRTTFENVTSVFKGSRPQGLATLSATFDPEPWDVSFTSNAPGLYPSELYSFPAIRALFLPPFSVPALFYETYRLRIGASTGSSHRKSCASFVATRTVNPSRGRLLSWVFGPLGYRTLSPMKKASSFFHLPLAL